MEIFVTLIIRLMLALPAAYVYALTRMVSPAGTATDNNKLTQLAQLTPIAFRTPAFQKLVPLCLPVVPATSQLIANPVFYVLIITVKTQLVVVVQLTTAAFQELLVQLHLILALPSLELHALIIIWSAPSLTFQGFIKYFVTFLQSTKINASAVKLILQ
jgi:hypothetical protein